MDKNCENCKKSAGCIVRYRIGKLTAYDPTYEMFEFFGDYKNIVDLSMKVGEMIAERCKKWEA
jgi:hypothetical protein